MFLASVFRKFLLELFQIVYYYAILINLHETIFKNCNPLHILPSLRFIKLFKYARYKNKYVEESSEQFENPVDFCIIYRVMESLLRCYSRKPVIIRV